MSLKQTLTVSVIVLGALSLFSAPALARSAASPQAKLKTQLSQQRLKMIASLKAYIEAGQFPWGGEGEHSLDPKDPHNEGKHPRVHRFQGPNGALCALAYLMNEHGGAAIVKRIIKTDNHFCVAMDKDLEVRAWILASGLTLEECIDIQRPGFRVEKGKLKFGELAQRERLRQKLKAVVAKLEKNNETSLTLAVKRAMVAG